MDVGVEMVGGGTPFASRRSSILVGLATNETC